MTRMAVAPVVVTLCLCMLFAFLPPSAYSDECDPCDITVNSCGTSPTYNNLEVHDCPAVYTCFKFFRRPCGTTSWTLIYEGTNNFFCDTGYGPEDCQQYKCQMWYDAIGSANCFGGVYCETAASSCDSGCDKK